MFDINNKCPPTSAITGQRQWGDIRLFFGCRNPRHDDIYHGELQNAVENKALTRVSTGYSRDKKKLKVNPLNSARVTGFIERGKSLRHIAVVTEFLHDNKPKLSLKK